MSLAAGTRLGPYEVLGLIGAGGMGEVYKAHDTRLDRTVAIKVLHADISTDLDRRARFEREAKTIAGLTHPHICTLHDVGEHDGSMFLVMEHLDGETLAHRIERGPLAIDQALTIAIDIADALSAAHRHGVIHRDLKPGNVMLTKNGAKLLDFGLAKLGGHDQGTLAMLVSAPTRSAPLTGEGVIVGTLQYMAPEQFEGRPADARTDLWALGAILYEMVTGKRAFAGTSAASLIGAILEREPGPMTAAQPLTPPTLDRVVRQCLAKAPDDRPDTAHDLANELRWLQQSSAVDVLTVNRTGMWRLFVRVAAFGAIGALLGGVLTWWVWARRGSAASPSPVVRSELGIEPAETLNAGGVPTPWLPTPGGSRTALTWTPDGRALVFVGRRGAVQQLYVRALDAAESRPLADTEGAQVPAVSADGRWVAFWSEGALKKVPLAGGPVMELMSGVDIPPQGLVWDSQGRLFFGGADRGIWQISADGAARAITTVSDRRFHILPAVLPGGQSILYTIRKRPWTWGDEEVVVLNLATGERKVLVQDAADGRYVATGHLVFLRRGVLFAVPFDSGRLALTGLPVPVIQNVAQALIGSNSGNLTGSGQFTIASSGSLAWIPAAAGSMLERALVTVDRRGVVSALGAPVGAYHLIVRASRDGRQILVNALAITELSLWLYDVARRSLTSLQRDGEPQRAVWSPDGQHVVFSWLQDGRPSLAWQPTDGSAAPEVLATGSFTPTSWGVGSSVIGLAEDDLAIVKFEKRPARVESLRRTSSIEQSPELSPDGRWLAYGSNLSGRREVYVEAYPLGGPRTPVSIGGGFSPAWHPNGRELFYVTLVDSNLKARMMAVDFLPSSPPRVGAPRVLFEFDAGGLSFGCSPARCYDVAPDGRSFFAMQTPTPPPPPVVTHINLIQNWFEELKAKVPTGK